MDIYLRIKELREQKKLSKKDFAAKIGVDNSQYGKFESGKLTPTIQHLMEISSNFDASIDWLLSGKGTMLKAGDKKNNQDKEVVAYLSASEGIPLIPIEAMAGFGDGEMQVMEHECERYVVPMFRDAEFMIRVKGSSMYPKYSSGDVVACKKLPLDTFFQWNKVYVLDTEQGALIKRIKKGSSDEHLLIVSENEKYGDFELHVSKIYSVAIVIGVIRLE